MIFYVFKQQRISVYYLLYYERSTYINNMIEREKEIKGWRRSKKETLINEFNPGWKFLNEEVVYDQNL